MDRAKSNPLVSVEAEMAYLGSLMFDRSKVSETAVGMNRSMFSVPAHQIIFSKIVDLAGRGVDGDIVVMNDELRANGTWKAVGGADYLMKLVDGVPNAENAKRYADTIRDLWRRRVLASMIDEIAKQINDTSNPIEPMDTINRAITAVGDSQGDDALIYLEALVDDAISKRPDNTKPVVTRIGKIDGNINLFTPGELTILAARPSVGKSSLMRQMIENAATAGVALVFSMEVIAKTLTQQFVCEFAGVPFSDWRDRRTSKEQNEAVILASARPELANIAVYQKTTITALDVSLAITRLQAQGRHPVAVFIDYLGLMKHDRAERHDLAVGSTTRMLKQFAIERKVPIILLAQLNRDVERRGGCDRPRLADLRDSGNIEQDADNVLFLWRKEEQDQYKLVEPRTLTIAKHRNGEVLEMELMFDKPKGRFFEVNDRGQAPPVAEWYSGK